jgi:hypothetical protein
MWADEVVPYCHSMAIDKKIDRAFYAFQSEPKEKPNVLILALNPYGTYSYADLYKNEKWEIPNGMTPDVFIHQNPFYKEGKYYNEKEKWNILEKFDVTLSANDDLKRLVSDMVYMNILYFNSRDFSEFKNTFPQYWEEAYTKCIHYTKFLIQNIIKPEMIICLGIDNCFNKIIDRSKVEELLPGKVHKTIMNETTVYGITHPSARISNEEKIVIGHYLSKDIFGAEIPENMADYLSKTKINAQEIVDYFRENPLGYVTEDKGHTIRFSIDGIDKDKLEVTLTATGGGYWGIRAAQKESNENLQYKDQYIEMLKKLGLEIYYDVWLGEKWFKCYGENIKEEIQSTIEKFISNF